MREDGTVQRVGSGGGSGLVEKKMKDELDGERKPTPRPVSNGKRTMSNGKAPVSNGTTSVSNGKSVMSNGTASVDSPQPEAPSSLKRLFERMVVPLLLMTSTPNIVILMWYCAVHCDGSYACVGQLFRERSILGGLGHMWSQVNYPSAPVVCVVVGYSLLALALMRLVPGQTVYGPLSPKGNRPQYTDNGFSCFLITIALFVLTTAVAKTRFSVSPTIIYDRFDEVLVLLNFFSLIFCLALYVKGLVAPSSSDSGSSGNFIFDYYWGTELYPRLLGFDVKVFTNCRFGMTVWPLLVCIFALKSYELHGLVDSMLVSAVLQMIYFTKFFWWEAGYMCTIDIMVDRAGYYICWGCLVFVPGFYTSVSLYLVQHPNVLGMPLSALMVAAGTLSIYVNYDADEQKLTVRRANGEGLVWGRKPSIIRAQYKLESGERKVSILLASGWWGLARHFHYLPEILLAFFWSLPALFDGLMPYTYVLFLTVLLVHRSFRDDTKCERKYGRFWAQYKENVPYRILPYVF